MATIDIKYDTKEKTMTCSCDGKAMANIYDLSFFSKAAYAYNEKEAKALAGKYTMRMSAREDDEDNDMQHMYHTMASEGVELTKAKKTNLVKDIMQYLKPSVN